MRVVIPPQDFSFQKQKKVDSQPNLSFIDAEWFFSQPILTFH